MRDDAAELDAFEPGHIGNGIAVGGLGSDRIDAVQAQFVSQQISVSGLVFCLITLASNVE